MGDEVLLARTSSLHGWNSTIEHRSWIWTQSLFLFATWTTMTLLGSLFCTACLSLLCESTRFASIPLCTRGHSCWEMLVSGIWHPDVARICTPDLCIRIFITLCILKLKVCHTLSMASDKHSKFTFTVAMHMFTGQFLEGILSGSNCCSTIKVYVTLSVQLYFDFYILPLEIFLHLVHDGAHALWTAHCFSCQSKVYQHVLP